MTNGKTAKQSKEYEKGRRDRLNKAFDQLSSVLPEYDPISSLSKVDILTKAFDYIKKLEADKCNSSGMMDDSHEKENTTLKAKVKHLSSRIRQLMDVMYSAKIKIPENLPPTSTYTPGNHCKWNGKAGDKEVESLLKRVRDKNKENKKNKLVAKQFPTGKSKQPPGQAKQTRTAKLYQQKRRIFRRVETNDKLGSLSAIPKVALSIADINASTSETSAKSVTTPSSVVPLQESNSKVNIISTSSNVPETRNSFTINNKPLSLVSTPIMATSITPTLPIQNFAQNSNVGTYILSNGQLMAVQQPAQIIPQIAPQILINRPVAPILLLQNNNNINTQPLIIKNNNLTCEPFANNCRPIYPKTKREITRTIFSTQKPIPSLSLTFSSIKCTKEMRAVRVSERKHSEDTSKKVRLPSSKKSSKDNIKKRSSSNKKASNSKMEKDNTILKMKRYEKIILKKSKLKKRVKRKIHKKFSNKLTNNGNAANSLSSKKTSSPQGYDVIIRKKSNLGSSSRIENSKQAKSVQNSNKDLNNPVTIPEIQSSTSFNSNIETCDFIHTSKSLVSTSLSSKGAFQNNVISSKTLIQETGEKVSCDLQVKTNSNSSEVLTPSQLQNYSAQNTNNSFNFDPKLVDTFNFSNGKDVLTQLGTFEKNSFLPILPPYLEDVREFSSDILSSLQIPSNLHNSESLSPTAAFLLSFPLVSTSKNSELLNENEHELSCESQNDNATSIMQIGSLESPSSAIIEGQAVLFDQQYTQIPKSNWMSKSCDKMELNHKYNENLSFDNSNVSLVHTPNHLSKKSSDFSNSPCKVVHSKNNSISSNGTNQLSGKNHETMVDKTSHDRKSNIPTTSINPDNSTYRQHVSLNFSPITHTVTTCATKELPKSISTVSTNLLPVFSEFYGSKVEKTSGTDIFSKSNERFLENPKKPSEKVKSKENSLNSLTFELSSDANSDAIKNVAKNCKDKVSSSSVNENSSNNTKSLVNWMTAPDVRLHGIEQFSNQELFSYQNFDFLATSAVSNSSCSTSFATTSIDQLFEYSSTTDNNKLYNPNYPAILNQTNVWSPSKSSLSHHIAGTHSENNFIIPSTLPTLVGDLALGTNTTPFVDAFKVASFETVSDSYIGQKISESSVNDSLKSNDRSGHNKKILVNANESQPGARCKIKENVNQLPCHENKQGSQSTKIQQTNKISPFKKSESNDKSQQTSGTNFLSVSQLVEQNQVKSHEIKDNQVLAGSKRNLTHLKQPNKNGNFSNICSNNEKCDNRNRSIKKGGTTLNNGLNENIDIGSGQRVFSQNSAGSKTEIASNCWQHQNTKDSSSLDASFKSNNYSTESLLNSGNNHPPVMNFNPISEFHNAQNFSVEKSVKLQSSSVGNFFIPSAQPYQSNQQQLINAIPASNPFAESFQFSNQNYRPDASNDKAGSEYLSYAPSSSSCLLSNKNSSVTKSELPVNFYPTTTNTSSVPLKNSKDKRPSCRQVAEHKNSLNVELNHGISSHISPPFSKTTLATSFPVSNTAGTGPVYTNTPSSTFSNKVEKTAVYYSNETVRKPCVSISDYAPFDDCNFKTPQNPLPITNALVPPSSGNNALYLPHTSLPCNVLPTSFNSSSKSFPNFLTPVVSTHPLPTSTNNMSCYVSSAALSSTSVSTTATNIMAASSTTTASPATVCSSGGVSNYLPTFIGSTASLSSPAISFSNYLPPVISTSKNNKRTSSCSASKSVASSCIGTYLPPMISTASSSSNTNKVSPYLPPVISTSSLPSSRNNSVANYLPNIIPPSSSADKNHLTNYLPPVISTTNPLSNSNLSNYLPPVLPAVNDASLYLPLTNIGTTGSSASTQNFHSSSSSSYTVCTTTNAKNNASSTQDKFALCNSHNNTPSYQPYIQSIPASNSAALTNTTNHLTIFSNKTIDPIVSSSYVPVFSNAAGAASSSNYLPIFSNSQSDLTIMSTNYLPLPTSNQGHNSVPPLNTAYTSNYLPSSSFPASNYFSVNLNTTVPHDLQIANPTTNFMSNTPSSTQCSSADIPCSSNFSMSASAPSRSSSKSCKTTTSSCKTFVSNKKVLNSSEALNLEPKKAHPSNKPNQDDIGMRTSNKENPASRVSQRSCNPSAVSKCTSFSSNSCNNLSTRTVSSSNQIESSALFDTSKPHSIPQIGGHFAPEHASGLTSSTKTSLAPTMLPLTPGSISSNNFSCIYSTSDSISYQPINLPNTFQNRPEFVDQVNIGPLPSFNNDASTYSIKNTPANQKYVPSNEQIIYNANSGSSTLTNFNLSAILPEMNDKSRCHNSNNSSYISRGVSEQSSFGKYDFYQYPEKKAHHPVADKKGLQIQHVGQTVPSNQFHLSNTKSGSSTFQNSLDTS